MDEQLELINNACGLLSSIIHHWSTEIDCSNTTLPQSSCMVMIAHVWERNRETPTLSRTELYTYLCTALGVTPRTAQTYVADAVNRNLLAIEPHPTDGRVKLVVISMRLYESLGKFSDRVKTSTITAFPSDSTENITAEVPFELRENNL
ncbi:hypothetical protein AB3480_30685 [Rhizobium mongolense]|uniref:hypothetical protein n=1 Tax=Rhizobium mongolense TaxID=57676 RepID=UPI0034A3732E